MRRIAVMAMVLLQAACSGGSGSGVGGAAAGNGGAGAGGGGGTASAGSAALTQPADLTTGQTGTIGLAAAATGDVAAVEFEVDGVPVGTDITAPYEASIDAADYATGQHLVRTRSIDSSGNASPWSSATVEFGSADMPAGFSRDSAFVTGLNRATAFVQAPDGRLFIAEQDGAVRVFKNGALLPTPALQLVVDSSGERGLIGITLDPAFAGNGRLYLHYTTPTPALGISNNRVSRFNVIGDAASPPSEQWLATFDNLVATGNNGGAIRFGADGKLYIGVGDNEVSARSQQRAHPFGKLLRINTDGTAPNDNPFLGEPLADARVWAYGLRNPATMAINPNTGRIHVNDIGATAWEEINLGVAGANYGWSPSEGPDQVGAGISGPLFAYGHSPAVPPGSGPGGFFVGMAIAGGAFYPSSATLFPTSYRGDYFFADGINRFVGRLDLDNGNAAYAFGHLTDTPVDMLVGLDGALYVLTRSGITRFSRP